MNPGALSAELPRLLYVGDVPVECSYHGSALLYRLLQKYPVDRLRIIEAGLQASRPDRRLKAVSYNFSPLPFTRLKNTRFSRWYSAANLVLAAGRVEKIEALIGNNKPQAVLSVTHGISWITAAEFARKHDLPLHLICHDEWIAFPGTLPLVRKRMDNIFGFHYRKAASRLCVSPSMIESYQRRYGTGATLLYPSREIDASVSADTPERLKQPERGLVFAYAGSLNSAGYRQALRLLGECLKPLGGKLLIFGPSTPEEADREYPNIYWQGLVDAKELISRLRQEADVLFVPMSFAEEDRPNMEISFPSKLTDYTAVGLPLLIYGPAYCSAIRWARENPGVAETVDGEGRAQLSMAVEKLAHHPEYLIKLGEGAVEAGERFFSHRDAWQIFQNALLNFAAKPNQPAAMPHLAI